MPQEGGGGDAGSAETTGMRANTHRTIPHCYSALAAPQLTFTRASRVRQRSDSTDEETKPPNLLD